MFDQLTAQKQKTSGKRLLAIASALIHLGLAALLVALGFWEIGELGRPTRGVAMATSIVPSSGGAAAKPAGKKIERAPKLIRENRQPSKRRQPDAKASGGDSGAHSADGAGGDAHAMGEGPPGAGGIVGALCLDLDRCGQAMPSVPKVEAATPEVRNLPPTVLSELQRVAGDPQIQPPTSTQNAMSRDNQQRIVALVRMCLNRQGQVEGQSILKSSEYPEYDAKLLSKMRRWRYQPYRANGVAIAICTHVTFIYQQEK